jgi:hypothetical protein
LNFIVNEQKIDRFIYLDPIIKEYNCYPHLSKYTIEIGLPIYMAGRVEAIPCLEKNYNMDRNNERIPTKVILDKIQF